MSTDNEQPPDRTSGRHAAPRLTVRGRIKRPVGRAIALTAMPTALLMGTLAPKLAFAADNNTQPKAAPTVQDAVPGPTGADCTKGAPGTGTGATATPSSKPSTATPTPSKSSAAATPKAAQKPAAGSGTSSTPTTGGSSSTPSQPSSGSTTPSAPSSPSPSPSQSSSGGLGGLLGGLGGILGLDSTSSSQAATPSGTPSASASPSASTSSTASSTGHAATAAVPHVVASATQAVGSATHAAASATPKPAASTPSVLPSLLPTPSSSASSGSASGGSAANKLCDISHLAAPLDTSVTSQLPAGTMPVDPWTLHSSDLKLINTEFHGVVTIQLADGSTERVLKFTADAVDIGNLDMSANQRGQEIHVKGGPGSTSTERGGLVTMYVKELKGTILAAEGIPLGILNINIDLTPDTLPQWLYNLIGSVPIPLQLELGNMTAIQAGQFGGNLTIPGMHLYYTPLGGN